MDNLIIGTYGWNYPEWQDQFYPEDLPSEWFLDYYANFSRLVLVPENEWSQWLNSSDPEAALEELVDCLLDESQLYCSLKFPEVIELGTEQMSDYKNLERIMANLVAWQSLQRGLTQLGRPADGLVMEVCVAAMAEQEVPPTWLVGAIRYLSGFWHSVKSQLKVEKISLIVNFSGEILSVETQLDSLRAELPYLAYQQGCLVLGDPIGWVEALPTDGKQQAELLKTFVASLPAGEGSVPVVVCGMAQAESIKMREVQNFKVVAELLGY